MDFTAIDFETANHDRTSACQVGLVVVKNDRIVESYSSYIKPSPNRFNPIFTGIHGIDAKTVSKAPTFDKLWPEIAKYLTDIETLVAHNAKFDISVLRACCMKYGIKYNLPNSFCTYQAAKKKLSVLDNHKLSTVSKYYGIKLNHHEALSDARACAMIAVKLMENS